MSSSEFKTVFLGGQGVGKSCILKQIVCNTFDSNTEATIACAFQSKTFEINGEQITFQLWDTAGQEAYRSLTKIYYQQSQIAFLVYDVTNKETFKNVQKWFDELKEYCDQSRMILILCGNKIDLNNEVVTYSEAKKVADQMNAELFLVSAKTGQGIKGNV